MSSVEQPDASRDDRRRRRKARSRAAAERVWTTPPRRPLRRQMSKRMRLAVSCFLALAGVAMTGLGTWRTVALAAASETEPEAGLGMFGTMLRAGSVCRVWERFTSFEVHSETPSCHLVRIHSPPPPTRNRDQQERRPTKTVSVRRLDDRDADGRTDGQYSAGFTRPKSGTYRFNVSFRGAGRAKDDEKGHISVLGDDPSTDQHRSSVRSAFREFHRTWKARWLVRTLPSDS
jgi:hypothetical protein